MLPYLQACPAPPLDGQEIVLAAPPGHLCDYLAERSHTSIVEELLGRFFGRPMRVTVQPLAPENQAPVQAAETAADLHKRVLGHPVVQAAVEILGGEVQEVRPRPPRRGKEAE